MTTYVEVICFALAPFLGLPPSRNPVFFLLCAHFPSLEGLFSALPTRVVPTLFILPGSSPYFLCPVSAYVSSNMEV